MKKNKQIMLDEDLIDDLKKVPSASGLINELLVEYFNQDDNLTLDKLKKQIMDKQQEVLKLNSEISALQERADAMETYDRRVKEVFKDIPCEILNDFKNFPKLNEEGLKVRYDNFYSVKYNIEFKEILEAFKNYYGNKN